MSPDTPDPREARPERARPAQPNPERAPEAKDEALEVYNTVAETVGGLSLRWKDNLYQGLAILASLVLGVAVGFLVTFDLLGALVGGFAGLLAGLLLSGVVLMVIGWVRAARNVRRWAGPDPEERDRRAPGGRRL